MPGSRLTLTDRESIAEGLAAGLGYAEIARRLARPTSTVTREIARNGGPSGYRPAAADVATRNRARRLDPPAPGPGDAIGAFEDRFAAMMVATGLSRMPARVLACLLASEDGGLSAAELVRRLRVSPASVSKAVAYLERLELVRRDRAAAGRRERYVVDDDAWYRASTREVEVCTTWANAAREGADLLDGTPAGARLDAMGRYFDHVGRDLARAAEHWREVFTAQ